MRILRALFQYLLNNEQLINRLADSTPIRRSARFVVYILMRAGAFGSEFRSISSQEQFIKNLREIAQRFKTKVREVKDDIKKEPPK